MSLPMAEKILLSEARHWDEKKVADKRNVLEQILEIIGYHTLATKAAASYLAKFNHMTAERLLDELRRLEPYNPAIEQAEELLIGIK